MDRISRNISLMQSQLGSKLKQPLMKLWIMYEKRKKNVDLLNYGDDQYDARYYFVSINAKHANMRIIFHQSVTWIQISIRL